MIIRLLRDPDVDKRLILKFALRQIKAIGYTKVLAMLLGALMVGVLLVIKIPQIRKILRPKTMEARANLALGLSQPLVTLETLAQFIHVTFNKQQGNSFVNYGELLLLGIQNIVLLLLLEWFRLRKRLADATNMKDLEQIRAVVLEMAKPVAVLVAVLLFLTKVAPPALVSTLQVLNIPIAIAAKIPQIRRNEQLRSTAHLLEVTIGANVIGSAIRVFTTLSNFRGRRDNVLLAGYTTSLALNATLAAQIIKYREDKTE